MSASAGAPPSGLPAPSRVRRQVVRRRRPRRSSARAEASSGSRTTGRPRAARRSAERSPDRSAAHPGAPRRRGRSRRHRRLVPRAAGHVPACASVRGSGSSAGTGPPWRPPFACLRSASPGRKEDGYVRRQHNDALPGIVRQVGSALPADHGGTLRAAVSLAAPRRLTSLAVRLVVERDRHDVGRDRPAIRPAAGT